VLAAVAFTLFDDLVGLVSRFLLICQPTRPFAPRRAVARPRDIL
jgi:hypothetical protein